MDILHNDELYELLDGFNSDIETLFEECPGGDLRETLIGLINEGLDNLVESVREEIEKQALLTA